jgi:ATP-binding cassette subfamily B protein
MEFKRIFYYFWNVFKQFKIALFSIFLFGAGKVLFSTIVSGLVYKNIIDTLGNDILDIETRYKIVVIFVISMGLSFVISTFLSRWGDYIYFRILTRVVKNVYDFSFQKVLNHSYTFFANNFTGSLVTRVKRFADSVNTTIDLIYGNFWQIFVAIIFSIGALYFQSKILSLYFLIWCLVYGILILLAVKPKIKIDLKWAEADSKITGFLADSISNILNIKIFSASNKESSVFSEVTNNYKKNAAKSFNFHLIRASMQSFLMITFHVFILFTMLNLWKGGSITLGVFVMAYAYMIAIFDRMWDLAHGLNRFMKAMTDAKEMVDIFDKVPDILDPESPETLKIQNGEIKFEDVCFEYSEDNEVFNNFSLHIKPGEKVGLVGHSGSGKTTITKMLLRFADVKDGLITIDRQNISKITQDDLRSKISYVPQEPILFHRSILENISYSNPNATKEEIIEAAQKAYAHEFIERLPNSYDTLVGERGIKLSGGERQRVAIARAMLKDAPILLLDEATSSLDSISETYIQQAFAELMKGKTTIVIAHRLSTIQKMDRIVVLDKGRIIEEGTHKELLEKGGTYEKLWNHQTGGFLE